MRKIASGSRGLRQPPFCFWRANRNRDDKDRRSSGSRTLRPVMGAGHRGTRLARKAKDILVFGQEQDIVGFQHQPDGLPTSLGQGSAVPVVSGELIRHTTTPNIKTNPPNTQNTTTLQTNTNTQHTNQQKDTKTTKKKRPSSRNIKEISVTFGFCDENGRFLHDQQGRRNGMRRAKKITVNPPRN